MDPEASAWMAEHAGPPPTPDCVWMGFLGWQPKEIFRPAQDRHHDCYSDHAKDVEK